LITHAPPLVMSGGSVLGGGGVNDPPLHTDDDKAVLYYDVVAQALPLVMRGGDDLGAGGHGVALEPVDDDVWHFDAKLEPTLSVPQAGGLDPGGGVEDEVDKQLYSEPQEVPILRLICIKKPEKKLIYSSYLRINC
jgi:hypothetical protein